MTTGRELLSAGIHAAGLSAAISSAAAAGLVGEIMDKSKTKNIINFNFGNEFAVKLFAQGKIKFINIPDICWQNAV